MHLFPKVGPVFKSLQETKSQIHPHNLKKLLTRLKYSKKFFLVNPAKSHFVLAVGTRKKIAFINLKINTNLK